MNNVEIFLDKYKQLEEVVRSSYNLKNEDSISYYLIKQDKYKKHRDELKYGQDVRNLLSHKKKLNNNFAVEPSPQMIEFIDNLISSIKNRKKCRDIQIKKKDVYWETINGNVKAAMHKMNECTFTHIPILNNDGVVIGVFDENSIFNYLANEEIVEINNELLFKDIEKYISLYNREMEEFIFIDPNKYVEELEHEIEERFNEQRRIGMAFVTLNGKSDGNLQGIITPWDIIALNK